MTKSAIPVWMMAIYAGFRIRTSVDSPLMCWLFWITLVFFALTYTEIRAKKIRRVAAAAGGADPPGCDRV